MLYICTRKVNVSILFLLLSNQLTKSDMARPIKETPELYGMDAERFEKLISNPQPVSSEEKERARHAYQTMKTISNFQW